MILAMQESENNFYGTGSLTERASAAGTIQDLSGRCGHRPLLYKLGFLEKGTQTELAAAS